ncbi:MAG TPA: HEAT repeat domain-containing protein [Thermoanaerobaculia bacterium]|nr:HEAT repeat domain-containing protein [Thermoanaerobaculia bacterium]
MTTLMLALLFATAPRLTNGSIQPLASLAQAPASGWIGYQVATPRGFSSCGCTLVSNNNSINFSSRDADDIGPASSAANLFIRFDNGSADRMRFMSPDCTVDANGHTIGWVDNVSEPESIEFLRRIVDSGPEHSSQSALLAISLHPSGTDTLIDIAHKSPSSRIRGNALFWLSQQAGVKAAAALKDAVNNDPEESVRAKAVFGISQLPNDESIPMLIDLLNNNRSREVRKKAAFWLGQKNDPRALQAIEEILKR